MPRGQDRGNRDEVCIKHEIDIHDTHDTLGLVSDKNPGNISGDHYEAMASKLGA